MTVRARTLKHILVIDIGGAHVKFRLDGRGPTRKFASGPKMTPADMMRQLLALTRKLSFNAVSIGYPGLVFRNRIAAEPHNLGRGWVGFDFAKAFGKPVRVINDAAMQAIGSYAGGRMLFLGLGTGLGATLIIDGVVEPAELGHLPYRHGRTYEDFLGERGRRRLGNAMRLKRLPRYARLGDNRNAFLGGLRLWQRGGLRVHLPGECAS